MQAVVSKLQSTVLASLVKKPGMENAGAVGGGILPLIIQLLPVLLQLLASCNPTPAPAKVQANNPGVLSRWRLRGLLLEQMPGLDLETVQVRQHLFDAILTAGKTVTEEDMAAVLAG